MKITAVTLSLFELTAVTRRFRLTESGGRWRTDFQPRGREQIHVLHVMTDEGLEGVCTVGDARYTQMKAEDLEQLRLLTLGEDPLDRARLAAKLAAAQRQAFVAPGAWGAFDNCLWDIAGKAVGQPVYRLMGAPREEAPAYYNFFGDTVEAVLEDGRRGRDLGFPCLKDHFAGDGPTNIAWFEATRAAFPDTVLLHDAALCDYGFDEAVAVGEALQRLGYLWFEEPIGDRELAALVALCARLEIPIAACETFMGDHALCAEWLKAGAADILRGNGRHGTTPLMALDRLAQAHRTTVELNGPGGLYGLVNAHLCCGLRATTYYEFFPGGTRDLLGKEIGLTNPPVPENGVIRPPPGPGWGAEWDRAWFQKVRVAVA
jgi:L-alanine-DL-glutamate epimerase-like enolase superfamily enzyme